MASTSPDATLVARCLDGDRDAFRRLVERHQSAACAVAYAHVGDRARSEDLAQDAFLAAWRALASLRERSAFGAWVCGIARNLARGERRARVVEEGPPPEDVPDRGPALDDVIASGESEAAVWRALEAIPARYREPMILYYREGRSATAVAEALGLTLSAVQQRLSRGRKYLRSEVERTVERTLEHARPSRGFAFAVLAGLPRSAPPVDVAAPAASLSRRGAYMTASILTALGLGAAAAIGLADEPASSSDTPATAWVDSTPREPASAAAADAPSERPRAAAPRPTSRPSPAPGPAYEITEVSPTKVAIALSGGQDDAHLPAAPGKDVTPAPDRTRLVRGVVRAPDGRPVSGAAVIAGRLTVRGDAILGDAGDVTDARGRFELHVPHEHALAVMALHATGWSSVAGADAGDAPVDTDLEIGLTAGLKGTLTRGDEPLDSKVSLEHAEHPFSWVVPVKAGSFALDRVAPGEYVAVASSDNPLGSRDGGRGADDVARLTLEPGRITAHDFHIQPGGDLVLRPRLASKHHHVAVFYYAFAGTHTPGDHDDLFHMRIDLPPAEVRFASKMFFELEKDMIFPDIEPGTWTLCIELGSGPRAAMKIGEHSCKVAEIPAGEKRTIVKMP